MPGAASADVTVPLTAVLNGFPVINLHNASASSCWHPLNPFHGVPQAELQESWLISLKSYWQVVGLIGTACDGLTGGSASSPGSRTPSPHTGIVQSVRHAPGSVSLLSSPSSHCSPPPTMPSPHITGTQSALQEPVESPGSHISPAAALTMPSPQTETWQLALQLASSPPASQRSPTVKSTMPSPQTDSAPIDSLPRTTGSGTDEAALENRKSTTDEIIVVQRDSEVSFMLGTLFHGRP